MYTSYCYWFVCLQYFLGSNMGNTCCQQHSHSNFQFMGVDNKLSKRTDGPSFGETEEKSMPSLPYHIKKVLQKQGSLSQQEDLSGLKLPCMYLHKKKMYYDGEWRKRKPHGKGAIFFDEGWYYQGYLSNGETFGKDCLFIYPDGSYYRGGFRAGIKEGEGKFIHANKNVSYTGAWKDDKPHGFGIEQFADGNKYEGHFEDGFKHGQGTFTWSNGMVYKGQFRVGYLWGEGFLKKGNSYYQGEFEKNLKKDEKGYLKTQYGIYEGGFENGEMSGEGKFLWNDKKVYQGEFQGNKLHGKGRIQYPNGQFVVGTWRKGENVEIDDIKS